MYEIFISFLFVFRLFLGPATIFLITSCSKSVDINQETPKYNTRKIPLSRQMMIKTTLTRTGNLTGTLTLTNTSKSEEEEEEEEEEEKEETRDEKPASGKVKDKLSSMGFGNRIVRTIIFIMNLDCLKAHPFIFSLLLP